MNQITADSSLKSQLDGLHEPVEVIDETGRRLGHFVPTTPGGLSDDCPYSAPELERMRNEQGGRSLAEIWRSLGAK
jgi:hypothetical protein